MYPTVTLTEEDGTPTGETVTASAPDHVALHGTLANGALLSVTFCGGYKSTPGRHYLLWVIDGDAGSIRIEGTAPGSAMVQIRPPKLYLDGEEIVLDEIDYLPRLLAAQFSEFAKGEEGKYATLDDAVKTRALLDAIARSGQNKVDL